MAITGVGTVFNRWNATSSGWEAIAEVNRITGPNMSRDSIDTTALDTEGGYRTFINGFRNAGEIQLEANFTRDGFEAFQTDFESDVPQDYQIVLPDTDETTLEFSGLVQELPLTIPPDDKVTMNVVIKISGPVTLVSGS